MKSFPRIGQSLRTAKVIRLIPNASVVASLGNVGKVAIMLALYICVSRLRSYRKPYLTLKQRFPVLLRMAILLESQGTNSTPYKKPLPKCLPATTKALLYKVQ